MPSITYIEHNGTAYRIENAPANRSLMQIAVDNNVPGILGDCGGTCSCATCHGYIDSEWQPLLPPISETEAFMLEGVPEPRETSRLCCQLRVTEALDGLVVRLPEEQV
jgi:2Fe-2S ferredoxin